MRSAYKENLEAFAHDLIIMCDTVTEILKNASAGLIEQNLQSAEEALSLSDPMDEIRERSTARAIELLALEGPVARDLRQVVSSIYVVEDFDRMGVLAMHVAKTARRRHPESVVPEEYLPYFAEMARLCLQMISKVREILVVPDADVAVFLERDDDAVDDVHSHLMNVLTAREWPHSAREAVDMALMSRFYERFADHCVNVAAQIVFLTSGLNPSAYLAKRRQDEENADMERRLEDIEKQFRDR